MCAVHLVADIAKWISIENRNFLPNFILVAIWLS